MNTLAPRPAAATPVRRRRLAPRLVHRRTVWWPTCWGWLLIVAAAGTVAAGWWFGGESFLATTVRPPPGVLVVEGWIGYKGVRAAAGEFVHGGYRWIVATGGMTSERWDLRQWSYAEMARRDLQAAGVPRERIVLAIPRDTEASRTYQTAVAVREALAQRAIAVRSLTVFTFGAHARRSRLIFARVEPPQTTVGVIAWRPADEPALPWWRSSDRAEDFLKETVGYFYELLAHSGRGFVARP